MMRAAGILLAALGGTGMVCFLLSVLASRIVNIGNAAGFLVSALLLVWGLDHKRIHMLLGAAWSRGGLPARAALVLAGLTAAAALAAVLYQSAMIVGGALRRPDPRATVLVLGCEVRGDRPSRMLAARIDAARRWLEDHPDASCVLSGGKGEDEDISEAECMYRCLTAAGIAPDRLFMEDRSTSTRENLLFSIRIMREKGLLGDDGRSGELAIVTNEFHACRAILTAESFGIRAGAVPAASPWWLLPTFFVRELFGLPAYMLGLK